MFKKMMGLGAAMALVGCGGGGDSANTNSTPQCPATQYLEGNICKNKGDRKLTQTGITTCDTETQNNLPCTKADLGDLHGLGQDGEVKAGQKMSYTLLTQNGADCVKDNVTGLLWEQKTDDGGLRDKDWSYTWYNTDSATNGGEAGVANGGTCFNQAGGAQCDTAGYVAALNAAKYCGYSDWQMPSEEELSSIVDFGRFNHSIDPIFSHMQDDWYWSASPSANLNGYAWSVGFGGGDTNYELKYKHHHVRAVRASQ